MQPDVRDAFLAATVLPSRVVRLRAQPAEVREAAPAEAAALVSPACQPSEQLLDDAAAAGLVQPLAGLLFRGSDEAKAHAVAVITGMAGF